MSAANRTEGNSVHRVTRPSIQVQDVNDIGIKVSDDTDQRTPAYEPEARRLRVYLRLYFYNAFKWKDNKCSFHIIYCVFFLLQVVKVALLTAQMIKFGHDRGNFSSVVNRGHITLKHLLVKGWDASWETLPYPPAHGDFAVYTISDWEAGINFAVERYHNAEKDAIGYYKRLQGDKMIANIKYFDFSGFEDTKSDDGKIHVYDNSISLDNGWSANNESYNITVEFLSNNITQPFKRMLEVSLNFTMHSVRSHVENKLATCLRIKGLVDFYDLDNNGQVNVDLFTQTVRIKCSKINLTLADWSLEDTSKAIGGALLAFCFISLLVTSVTVAFAIFTLVKTKLFMKKYYQEYYGVQDKTEKDLPVSEYFHFLKIWDILTIIADILTVYSTVWIVFNREESDWLLETLDSYTMWLGIACVMAWLSLLRFFKIHNKFHLLFSTLYHAFWDVLAYLVCVIVLFVGFWICGFVVLGPYHVKFQTPWSAAETLFSIINGDEIYATLAIQESSKSGGPWVFWFSKFYLGIYVAVFTIVVINLLIALFMSAYEAIKERYDNHLEDKDLGPVEKALRQLLLQHQHSSFRSSINELMVGNETGKSKEEIELKKALGSLIRIAKSSRSPNSVVFLRPRTLKAFMEDGESGRREFHCGNCCICSFPKFTDGR